MCPGLQAESPFFRLSTGQTLELPPPAYKAIVLTPTALRIEAPTTVLNGAGARTFLTVVGELPGGARRNLTYASTGTTYSSSNAKVVEVDASGSVKALGPGKAIVGVFHQGRTGSVAFTVVNADAADSDGDGMSERARSSMVSIHCLPRMRRRTPMATG